MLKMSYVLQAIALAFILLYRYSSGDSVAKEELKEKICMSELGCFDLSPPFWHKDDRPIGPPEDRLKINTTFFLYTSSNLQVPASFSNLQRNVKNISKTSFNPEALTLFIVPGFNCGNAEEEWKKLGIKDVLRAADWNMFLVDWHRGAGSPYKQSVANARVVGAEIAVFIKRLQKIEKIRLELVHLIGHSLGSHVVGYAGKRLAKPARITGLDPAGPYFENVNPIVRLDRKDADFVDIIHTCAGDKRFGINQSIGHFDFYPNGGGRQPGCEGWFSRLLKYFYLKDPDSTSFSEMFCSHARAAYLYISSMRNTSKPIMGVVCDTYENFLLGRCGSCSEANALNTTITCIPMGQQADAYSFMKRDNESLNIYLNTTDAEPFYLS